MNTKIIEITQDAACIIENKNKNHFGIFTAGIQTCLIYIFETNEATILIHDSGQLDLQSMANIINSYGEIKNITVAFGINLLENHQERLSKLLTLIGKNPNNNIDVIESPYPTFSLCYRAEKTLELFADNEMPKGIVEIPNKQNIQTIIELNNFFLTPNEQSLIVDIQYINSEFTNKSILKYSINEMLKILEQQQDFFFQNLGLLMKGYELSLYKLPLELIDLSKKYKVLNISVEVDKKIQTQAFTEFINITKQSSQ